MKLYVAMVNDHHREATPSVFSTPDAAITYARTQAHKRARSAQYVEETDTAGRLYHATYSGENDYVFVVEKDLDTP